MLKTIENYGIQTILWAGVAVFAAMVMLPFYAKADVAECGVNHSRMNPTELSAYQKCWLDTHRADETHGVLGSLFWVKAGGEYYSTQISNLRTTGQQEAFLATITTDYDNALTAAANEVAIETIEGDVAVLKEVVEVVKVVTVLKDTGIYTDAQYETLAEMYDAKVMELAEQIMFSGIALDHLHAEMEDMEDKIAELKAEVSKLNAQITDVKAGADHGINFQTGNGQLAQQHVRFDKHSAVNAVIAGKNYDLIEVSSIKVNIELNNVWNVYNIDNAKSIWTTQTGLEELTVEIARIVEDTYNTGYDDGYAAGYKAGFADGVASVQ